MSIKEIKSAMHKGYTVKWSHNRYEVVQDGGKFFVKDTIENTKVNLIDDSTNSLTLVDHAFYIA